MREGAPQMDKISCSLSMMYAAFKLLSSSLEQEQKDWKQAQDFSVLDLKVWNFKFELKSGILNLKYSEKWSCLSHEDSCSRLYTVQWGSCFSKGTDLPQHTILIYFIYRSNGNSSIQYASSPSLHGHNFCDILWDQIPLFKIPNVELVIKQYRENKQTRSMQPKG